MIHFLKKDHFRTLIATLLYFNCSFMIWFLYVANFDAIFSIMKLSSFTQWSIVCIPFLCGALFRIPMGYWVDRYGGKKMALINMAVMAIPLLMGWIFGNSIFGLIIVGMLLGISGASFSVAIPLVSQWFSDKRQGIVTGIIGAGNVGAALSIKIWPKVGNWHTTFLYAFILLVVVYIIFAILAKEAKKDTNPMVDRNFLPLLKNNLIWLYSFLYSLSFGSFICLAIFLSKFFVEHYHTQIIDVIDFVVLITFGGSLFRPLGGYLADRFSGTALLITLFRGAAFTLIIVGVLPNIYVELSMLFITLFFLGIANGVLFQLIAVKFKENIGVISGIVGAMGSFGGVVWTYILHILNYVPTSFSIGFWTLGIAVFIGMLFIMKLQNRVEEA